MSFSPLRLLSPIQLFFCLILFFLPWVEVQCVMPKDGLGGFGADPMPGMKADAGKRASLTGSRPFVTQSGLQVATGEYSFASPELKALMEGAERPDARFGEKGPDKDKEKSKLGKSVVLFFFPVLVLVGGVLGIVLGPGLPRRLVVAGCCAGAIGVVGIQAAIGFPIEQRIKEKVEEEMEVERRLGANVNEFENPYKVVWKFPLYLTLLLLVGATGTAFVDGGVKKRKPKRVSYDFDDDEDDEEYEDDRPRRKKKKPIVEEIPDDDEEEERPRKQRRPRDDEDDDEDDRPRRKRRRDDDD